MVCAYYPCLFVYYSWYTSKTTQGTRALPQGPKINQNHPGHYKEFLPHGVHARATPSGPVGHDQRKVPEIWKHQSPSLAKTETSTLRRAMGTQQRGTSW